MPKEHEKLSLQILDAAIEAISTKQSIVWTQQTQAEQLFVTFATIDIITGQINYLVSKDIRQAFVENSDTMMAPKLTNEDDLYLGLIDLGFEPLIISDQANLAKAGSHSFTYSLTDYLVPVTQGPYTIENTLNPQKNKKLMYGLLEQNATVGVFINDPEEVTAEVINELLLLKNQLATCHIKTILALVEKIETDLRLAQDEERYLDLPTLYRYQASIHMARLQVTDYKLQQLHVVGFDKTYLQSPDDRIIWVSDNADGTFSYLARSILSIVDFKVKKIVTDKVEEAFVEDAMYRRFNNREMLTRKAEQLQLQGYFPIRLVPTDKLAGSQAYDFINKYLTVDIQGRYTLESIGNDGLSQLLDRTIDEIVPTIIELPYAEQFEWDLKNPQASAELLLLRVVNELLRLKNFLVMRPNNLLANTVALIEEVIAQMEPNKLGLDIHMLGMFANNLEFGLALIENDVIDEY